MPRVRPLEVKALLPLLERDWQDPEELAEALISALDEARISRTSYVGVMRIGLGSTSFLLGIGPYPGRRSAENALADHPTASDHTLCTGLAVVPVETPLGIERRLKELAGRAA